MGSFNFGESTITDGVKIILECGCEEEECSCYGNSDDYIEEMKNLFSNVSATLEHKINEDYSINICMEEPTVEVKHGYYDGVALDYNEGIDLTVTIFRNDGENLPNIGEDEGLAFEEMLSNTELPDMIQEELLYAVHNVGDSFDTLSTELSDKDKDFFNAILIAHSNAVVPTSRSVGWVTSNYETDISLPDVTEDMSWTSYCNL